MFTEFCWESARYRPFEIPKKWEDASRMLFRGIRCEESRWFGSLIMTGSGTGRVEHSNFITI
jgi:hypothetical protein